MCPLFPSTIGRPSAHVPNGAGPPVHRVTIVGGAATASCPPLISEFERCSILNRHNLTPNLIFHGNSESVSWARDDDRWMPPRMSSRASLPSRYTHNAAKGDKMKAGSMAFVLKRLESGKFSRVAVRNVPRPPCNFSKRSTPSGPESTSGVIRKVTIPSSSAQAR